MSVSLIRSVGRNLLDSMATYTIMLFPTPLRDSLLEPTRGETLRIREYSEGQTTVSTFIG